HGKENGHAAPIKGISYWLPLTVLLVLSTGAGALLHPEFGDALPAAPAINEAVERHIQLLSGGIALLGIAIAALLFLGERRLVRAWSAAAP
ncbi:NADH-quinone oxidoreductase subunit L, partial [Escherichia coli]